MITDYEVEIRNSAGEFVSTDECKGNTIYTATDQDGENMHVCRVKMDTLRDPAGYNLAFDDYVIAEVRAVNAAGSAEWAESTETGQAAQIKTAPEKMANPPVRGNLTSKSLIHITWDAQTSNEETGGSEIIEYIVYDGSDDSELGTTSDTSYSVEGLSENDKMTFKIASTNLYGTSELSDVSEEIVAGSVPAKSSNLSLSNPSEDASSIVVNWDTPTDTVTKYELQFRNYKTNEYETAPDWDEDSAVLMVENPAVELDSSGLKDKFGYLDGDQAVGRLRAGNDFGWGEFSYPTTNTATVYK